MIDAIYKKVLDYYKAILQIPQKSRLTGDFLFNELDWPQIYLDSNITIIIHSPTSHSLYYHANLNHRNKFIDDLWRATAKKEMMKYYDHNNLKARHNLEKYLKLINYKPTTPYFRLSTYLIMDKSKNISLTLMNEKLILPKDEHIFGLGKIKNIYPGYLSLSISDEYKAELYKLGYILMARIFLKADIGNVLITGIENDNLRNLLRSLIYCIPSSIEFNMKIFDDDETKTENQRNIVNFNCSNPGVLSVGLFDKISYNYKLHFTSNLRSISSPSELTDRQRRNIRHFLFSCLYDLVAECKLFR